MASSASTEQWIFTGGNASSSASWVLLMVTASSRVLPFIHSVARELEAMADRFVIKVETLPVKDRYFAELATAAER